ncbi:hypothetical protein ACGF4C_24460 [Streptomyces sp. NPDC048197]|uniref:hypothetical protein n=1 Tax=Streptomyces sp. NPDC048197 TaxID=3365511 RepID=UPI003711A5DD
MPQGNLTVQELKEQFIPLMERVGEERAEEYQLYYTEGGSPQLLYQDGAADGQWRLTAEHESGDPGLRLADLMRDQIKADPAPNTPVRAGNDESHLWPIDHVELAPENQYGFYLVLNENG